MKICVIPIDNRPVCYNLFKDITAIDEDIELFIPPREFLGDLTKNADISKLFEWLKSVPKVDNMVVSLDTLAYGGLIPSRRCPESFEEIKSRVENLKEILKQKDAKIFAFSSIMRISNNNVNQEEKEYWKDYGTKIFEYSFNSHKLGKEVETDIPVEILEDYKNTRKRNFEINKIYLNWQKEGLFDTLVFSKDDCAEFGFNVQEARELENLGGFTKTGADEIPLTLMARAIQGEMKVFVEFTEPNCKDLISNYEDVSIEKSVLGQLELAGISVTDNANSDVTLVVNNFKEHQGEIVMKRSTEPYSGDFKLGENMMIADVRFANGADNAFVEKFINEKMKNSFYGYSAWNTSANSLGSLLCGAKVKFLAKKYNEKAFKKLQAIRLLDDWAYQANVRQILEKPKTFDMKKFENRVSEFLDLKFNAEYSFPWNRLFEVEVNLK